MNFHRKHFQTLDSTNSWAKRNCAFFCRDEITLITADEQTAGRGRFNRKWKSPPSQNIYATFSFFISDAIQRGSLPQILALSLCKALEQMGFKALIKWPNDILFNSKKVGGILTEVVSIDSEFCAILGLGLNVNMSFQELQEIDQPATSLRVEMGGEKPLDLQVVLNLIQEQFSVDLVLFLKEGFSTFFQEFVDHIALQSGQILSFQLGNNRIEGAFHSINQDGSISLKLPSGEIRAFYSGEIGV